MAGGWSPIEVEAVVADYLAMLKKELANQPYNKSHHRKLLSAQLSGRSDGSIERKHQNISAVLIELGHPWISGYKPLGNYQALLGEVVADQVAADEPLILMVEQAVQAVAVTPQIESILGRLEDPPENTALKYASLKEKLVVPGKKRLRVNYLQLEARNASLGRAGEEFVVQFEQARLAAADKHSLADRVEHTAAVEGDGAGFDIRSFEPDGSDRFIEVKTTAYGKQTPFFVTRNEIAVSKYREDHYHLYRLFRFRDVARLYMLSGSIENRCLLEATQFIGRPK